MRALETPHTLQLAPLALPVRFVNMLRLWLLLTTAAALAVANPHKYDLSHLVQADDQVVAGPVQDDEALLLFAVIRTSRLRRVLELGGFTGYSAHNFLKAMSVFGDDRRVYTVDVNPVPLQGDGHVFIHKNARDVAADDVGNEPLDMVFFDCHDLTASTDLFSRLEAEALLTSRTLIVLHDTNLHYHVERKGVAHQPVERQLVMWLKHKGYDSVSFHTSSRDHGASLPYRHGVTIMQRFAELH